MTEHAGGRIGEALGRATTAVGGYAAGIATLQRAGVVDVRRPDRIVRALRTAESVGPVAGAIRGSRMRSGSALALVDELGRLTFDDLDERATALAAAWRRDGVGPDSTVAVLCRDSRHLVTAMAATGIAGARLLLCNTGFAAPQLGEVLVREGADVLVHDQALTDAVAEAPDSLPRVLGFVDDADAAGDATTLDQLIAGGRELPEPPLPDEAGRVVLLTSGTTGTPKGAPRQVRTTSTTMQILDRVPLGADQRVIVLSPMFHGTGLALGTLTLAVGSTLVLVRRFDPAAVLHLLEEERLTGMVAVPTQLRRLLDLPADELDAADTSALSMIVTAGSALPGSLSTRAMARFGPVLHNLYGSTEVAVATVATPDQLAVSPGTVGTPPRGCRVRLYDDAGRRVEQPGVVGRIFVDNGTEFEGYTNGGTKPVIDGFMGSGDTGHLDEHGLLHVDGRDDDMIVSGGENVFPAEVAELLVGHDDIADATVVGVDDEDFGQRLAAYVVPMPGASLDAETVRDLVRSNLARHKVPRDVVMLDDLPRNATGKVLRRELPPTR